MPVFRVIQQMIWKGFPQPVGVLKNDAIYMYSSCFGSRQQHLSFHYANRRKQPYHRWLCSCDILYVCMLMTLTHNCNGKAVNSCSCSYLSQDDDGDDSRRRLRAQSPTWSLVKGYPHYWNLLGFHTLILKKAI